MTISATKTTEYRSLQDSSDEDNNTQIEDKSDDEPAHITASNDNININSNNNNDNDINMVINSGQIIINIMIIIITNNNNNNLRR